MINIDQDLTPVLIDSKYCNYLRQYDHKVVYNMDNKDLRPFIGILFQVDNKKYFAPLSSPKQKHFKMRNTIDFIRIDNGKLGAINFNNMIPLIEGVYQIIDLSKTSLTVAEQKYQDLLIDQRNWLNMNRKQLRNRAKRLYQNYKSGKLPKNIKDRCCNFLLLEEKCLDYK